MNRVTHVNTPLKRYTEMTDTELVFQVRMIMNPNPLLAEITGRFVRLNALLIEVRKELEHEMQTRTTGNTTDPS